MNFIEVILARIFDTFKASNPKLAAIIIFVLGVLVYAANNGLAELIGTDLTKYVEWVLFILAALTGSRTTKVLNQTEKK